MIGDKGAYKVGEFDLMEQMWKNEDGTMNETLTELASMSRVELERYIFLIRISNSVSDEEELFEREAALLGDVFQKCQAIALIQFLLLSNRLIRILKKALKIIGVLPRKHL